LHDVTAVHLNDIVNVDDGQARRDQNLDDEFVARRLREVRRRAQPPRQFLFADLRDPVVLLTFIGIKVV
jgi:hypothetical protein